MIFNPENEPVLNYAPGSDERKELKKAIEEARSKELKIPMIIGGKEVYTEKKVRLSPPSRSQAYLRIFL